MDGNGFSRALKLPDNLSEPMNTPIDNCAPNTPHPRRSSKRLRDAFALPSTSVNLAIDQSQPSMPDMSQDTLALFPPICRTNVDSTQSSGIAKAALYSTLNRATSMHNPFLSELSTAEKSKGTPRIGTRWVSHLPPLSATPGTQESCDSLVDPLSNGHDEREALKMLFVAASQPRKFSLDFEEIALAGEGDFSQVLRARCRIDGVEYAVKRNKKMLTSDKMKEEALKEVFALAALQGHPCVLRYHTAWFENSGQTLYIQTALMSCGNLFDNYVRADRKMPKARLRSMVKCIAGAMEYMHERGITHHDIKPDNIFEELPALVDDSDSDSIPRYVLGDFGITTSSETALSNLVEGDSRYLCPEALNGVWRPDETEDESLEGSTIAKKSPDPDDSVDLCMDSSRSLARKRERVKWPSRASDLFSLGVTIYELATAEPVPKSGPVWLKLRTDPDAASQEVEFACGDPALTRIVRQCLIPDPALRCTAKRVVEMLNEGFDEIQRLKAENARLQASLKVLRALVQEPSSTPLRAVKKLRKTDSTVRTRRALGNTNR